MTDILLFRFEADFGRSGTLTGLFAATKADEGG